MSEYAVTRQASKMDVVLRLVKWSVLRHSRDITEDLTSRIIKKYQQTTPAGLLDIEANILLWYVGV